MESDAAQFKVVVVGDGAVGKTSLLITYSTDSFPGEEYIPTVFDNYSAKRQINGKNTQLNLWDTAGQEDYDTLRPMSYPQTDVFVVCFDISKKDTLYSIQRKWIQEIREHCPDTPIILVGTKLDKREQYPKTSVDYKDALTVAKQVNAYCYVECSAKTQEGIENVFLQAIKATSQE